MNDKRVLIVEDESIIATFIKRNLARRGFRDIETVTSGEEAIEIVRKNPPRCLLMDIMLRGEMDGIAAAGEIQKEHDIPVVFITAHTEAETMERAAGVNPYGYIVKPMNQTELILAVEIAISRHEMDRRVRESEQKYRLIAENSSDVIWTMDKNLTITYVSPSAERMRGFTVEEIHSQKMDEMVTPESLENIRTVLLEEFNNEKNPDKILNRTRTLEVEFLRKGGGTVWVEMNVTLLHDAGGNLLGIQGVDRDITERKAVEKALQKSEEQYRDLVENIKDIVYTIDTDGVVTYVSPVFEEVTGFAPAEVVGKPFIDFIFPDDHGLLNGAFADALTGDLSSVEFRIVGKDGGCHWMNTRGTLMYDGGKVAGIRGVLNGIQKLKCAMDMMEEYRDRYRSLMEGPLNGVYISDFQGNFIDANDTALEIAGYTREEITNLNFANLIDEDQLATALEYAREIQETGSQSELQQYRIKRKDGTCRWVETQGSAIRKKGEPMAIQSIVRDITDRKRLEDELWMFRQSLDSVSISVFWIRPDGRFAFANGHACKTLGYTTDEMLSMGVSDIDPDHPVEAREERWKLYRENESVTFETRHMKRDGSIVPVEITSSYIEADGDEFEFAFAVDISDRKEAEEALRKSEFEKSLIMESIKEMISYYDTDLTIRWTNRASADSAGKTPEEMIGTHCYEVWQGRDEPCENCPVLAARDTGEPQESEALTPDGRYWHIRGYPVFDDTGKVAAMTEFGMDITEGRKARKELEENEERIRYILKHNPNAVAVYDNNLHYMHVSDRYMEDYQVKDRDIIGRHHYEVFPEIPQRWREIHRRALKGEILESDDDYFERPDGTRTYNRWECRPWYTPDGGIGGMITYTEVTTERKLAEIALRESEEKFRSMFTNNHACMLIIDPETGILVDVNPAAERFYGWDREKLLEMNIADINTLSFDHILEEMGLAVSMKKLIFNFQHYLATGEVRDVVVYSSPVKWGGRSFLFSIVTDITEQREAEKTLDEIQRLHEVISGTLTDFIYSGTVDPDGTVTTDWVLGGVDRTTGYTVNEIQEMPDGFRSIMLPEDLLETAEAIRSCILALVPGTCEYRIRKKNGETVWLEDYIRPSVDDRNPKFIRLDGAVKDITSRKEAERIIEKQRDVAMSLNGVIDLDLAMALVMGAAIEMEGIDCGAVYLLDEKTGGIMLKYSFGFTDAFVKEVSSWPAGSPQAEYLMKAGSACASVEDFFSGEFGVDVPEFVGREGLTVMCLNSITCGDRMMGSLVVSSHGAGYLPRYVVNSLESIATQFGNALVRLRAEEEIRASLKEKEVLLKEIHHRVKNNMQVISSLVSLRSDSLEDDTLRKSFQEIEGRIRSMALIHEMLYQSKNLTEINFSDYLDVLVAELYHTYVADDRVSLTTDIEDVYLNIDHAIPCSLIIYELVSNALKYGFPGGKEGTVRVEFTLAKGVYAIRVSDNGIGLPDGFDPGSVTTLGLELVYSLAGQLDGRVVYAVNEGTAFTVTFPKKARK